MIWINILLVNCPFLFCVLSSDKGQRSSAGFKLTSHVSSLHPIPISTLMLFILSFSKNIGCSDQSSVCQSVSYLTASQSDVFPKTLSTFCKCTKCLTPDSWCGFLDRDEAAGDVTHVCWDVRPEMCKDLHLRLLNCDSYPQQFYKERAFYLKGSVRTSVCKTVMKVRAVTVKNRRVEHWVRVHAH